jgi:hypothetical protein
MVDLHGQREYAMKITLGRKLGLGFGVILVLMKRADVSSTLLLSITYAGVTTDRQPTLCATININATATVCS